MCGRSGHRRRVRGTAQGPRGDGVPSRARPADVPGFALGVVWMAGRGARCDAGCGAASSRRHPRRHSRHRPHHMHARPSWMDHEAITKASRRPNRPPDAEGNAMARTGRTRGAACSAQAISGRPSRSACHASEASPASGPGSRTGARRRALRGLRAGSDVSWRREPSPAGLRCRARAAPVRNRGSCARPAGTRRRAGRSGPPAWRAGRRHRVSACRRRRWRSGACARPPGG